MQAPDTSCPDIVYLPVAAATGSVKTATVGGSTAIHRRGVLLTVIAALGAAGLTSGLLAGSKVTAADAAPADIGPVAVTPGVINPGPALPMPTDADRAEWALFKARTMTADGRIIDTSNGGESHSEGQGVGMLFAVAFDDQEAFDRLHGWTRRNLLRSDGLHAWRYLANAPVPIPDTNNATDGDIYIAAALQRAARRWNRIEYADASLQIARSIHELLLQTIGNRVVLLPGGHGFVHPDRVSVNLSYYVFPLLAELNCAYPSARWERVRADGVALIQGARYGRWSLPPDWLDIHTDGALAIAKGFPPRFSWDAVRVPLFLAWSGHAADTVDAASAFWSQLPGPPPAWVDLKSGETASYPAPPGIQAIAAIAASSLRGSTHSLQAVNLPTVQNDLYYSAALTLLARMALREMSIAHNEI